ncbi:MAG TPA: glycosyltransferase family 2 protein [Caulobacteraceae bacterium]|nr:glycosyltransferase family 2 protein [Caulobacteraceae bacterium]
MEIALKSPTLSLVVPVHNEVGAVGLFLARAAPVLRGLGKTFTYEIVFVDDGSTDATLAELLAARAENPRIRIVALSRNFGKDTALAAGLAHASGQAVIPIDVDLQDPPEVIPQLLAKWREGFDVVNARRADRSSDSWMKRATARSFYRVFNQMADRPILEDVGDFRLLSRRVVDVVNQFPERARFMKGLFSWVGFRQATIDYQRGARAAGETKWRYWRLWNFAVDGITSFTTVPLRIWTYFGATIAVLAFVFAAVLIARTILFGIDTPGYASLMVVVLFFGGVNLLSLGVIGEYLGRTYTEVKGRPLYIIDRTWGFEGPLSGVLARAPKVSRARKSPAARAR